MAPIAYFPALCLYGRSVAQNQGTEAGNWRPAMSVRPITKSGLKRSNITEERRKQDVVPLDRRRPAPFEPDCETQNPANRGSLRAFR